MPLAAGAVTANPLVYGAVGAGSEALAQQVEGSPTNFWQIGLAGAVPAAFGYAARAVPWALGKVWRSAPDMPSPGGGIPAPGPAQIQRNYVSQLGGDIEGATRGILKAGTPEELDALVYGTQGAGGKLATGRRALGDFYKSKVDEAADALSKAPDRGVWTPTNDLALGGDKVLVPALSSKPIALEKAIEEIKNIGPQYSGTNPALRTQVGAPTRAARAQAWAQLHDYLGTADPSGAASAAIGEARTTFALGANYIDAVRKSGAIVRRPNEISFDSSKFQDYVAKNRANFIDAFDKAGVPEAWPAFVRIVFRGGDVGTRDVVNRTMTGVGDAAAQLFRQGGGSSTGALLPARTVLPGLGNQYTGTAPYSLPPPRTGLTPAAASLPVRSLGQEDERQ